MTRKSGSKLSLLEQYQQDQALEWGVYVCGPQPIDIGNARAFNPGDAVPASHVTRGVVREDQVIALDDQEGLDSLTAELSASPDGAVDLPGLDAPNPDDREPGE